MSIRLSQTLALTIFALVSACSDDSSELASDEAGLRAGMVAADDVAAFTLSISTCGGTPVIVEQLAALTSENGVPANLQQLFAGSFEVGSQHHFAEYFYVLKAGCYNVFAQPLLETSPGVFQAHPTCSAAGRFDVWVQPGATSEVFLLSQCDGDDPGSLQNKIAVNHEPIIDSVVVNPQSASCGQPATICATASDQDNDPLRYQFDIDPNRSCTILENLGNCVSVQCADAGEVHFDVRIYDQVIWGGSYVDIESLLGEFGSFDTESHAAVHSRFSVTCGDATPARYRIEGLGEFNGAPYIPVDINQHNVVAINLSSPNAIYRYHGGIYEWVPGVGSGQTATGINDNGDIVGYGLVGANHRGFVNFGGAAIEIGALPGGTSSFANAINDLGVVVGSAVDSEGYSRSVIYQGGALSLLDPQPTLSSEAAAINNMGQIAGTRGVAYLHAGGALSELPGLGGGSSTASDINVLGQVTGKAWHANGEVHAYVYYNSDMTDLGTLGGVFSEGEGINDLGQVVGVADHPATNANRAFLYENGVMTDLNELHDAAADHWELSWAYAINNAGVIVGFGLHDGVTEGFIAIPN